MRELILGGARSGKSKMAEAKALHSGHHVSYIATATVYDDEMQARVNQHKNSRPQHWNIVEEPINLATAIEAISEQYYSERHNSEQHCIIIDCLTLWLTNLLMTSDDTLFATQKQALLHAIQHTKCHLIMVSNETGMGIIPLGDITRRFVDEAGKLHQEIAAIADQVTLSVAGLPHVLKCNSDTIATKVYKNASQTK